MILLSCGLIVFLRVHVLYILLQGILKCDALTVYNDMVEKAEDLPKWNPTVLKVQRLQLLDDNTELCYNVAAEGAGGMVTSR